MANWIDVGSADSFAPGSKTCRSAGEVALVICHVAGQIHAVLNVCPHAALPLGDGQLSGKVLTCPFHGFAFNVESGQNVDFPDDMALSKFPTRTTADGRVEVDLDG